MRILLMVLVGLSCMAATSLPLHAKQLTLACLELKPYTEDPERPNGGLIADITATVVREAGYDPNILLMPWNRLFALAKRGEIDGVFCTTFFEDRLSFLAYTENTVSVERYVLFKLKDRQLTYDSPEALKQYRFAEVTNSAWEQHLKNMGITKVLPINAEDLKFRALLAGRIDFAVADQLIGWTIIDTCCAASRHRFEVVGSPLRVEPQHISISKARHKDADAVAASLDAAFDRLREDGRLANIYARQGLSGSLAHYDSPKQP